MLKIPFVTWIANAAAGLTGLYGDVAQQAKVADCSRQTVYDHAQKVQAAVEAEHQGGPTWAEALHDWTALEFVAADAGTGLRAGIAAVQHQRRESGQTPLGNGLDVFHTTQEARRVLLQNWNQVERCWEQAEAARRRVEQA